jgi:MFS family permease
MKQPAISKLLVNMAFSGLSYGVYYNFVQLFIIYLDPIGYYGDFALYYLVLNLTSAVALPLGGVLSDKIGRKSMLVFGSLTLTIGIFILPISTVWWYLLYSSVLQAVGSSFLSVAQSCVIADVTKGYTREKGYSITMSFSMIFGVVGTVMLAVYSFLCENVLSPSTYYELPLIVAAVLALIATIPMLLIKVPSQPKGNDSCNPRTEKNGKSPNLNNSRDSGSDKSYTPPSSIWRNGLVLKMIAFQGIIGFGAGFLVPVFIYYWVDIFHSGNSVILLISVLGELGIAAGGLIAPWLAKRAKRLRGRVGTTVACQFASIACAAYLAIVPYYRVLLPAVGAYIARNSLMNMVNPLIQAETMDHTPEDKRGIVNSLTALAFLPPNGLATILSDPLVHSVQTPYGYTYSASALIVTYIIGTVLISTTGKKDRILLSQSRQAKS